jgi:putative phage-type endonuclease
MTAFDEERLTGIGGSDAPAVVGISPWATPYELWLQKLEEAPPPSTNEPMLWGKLLEPVIIREYVRRTGRTVELMPMLRHPTHEFMICHLDGRVDRTRILECKMTRTAQGWGESGTDEIPLHVGVQVHHNLIVSGAQIGDVPVLIGGNDFRIYEVHADHDIARNLIKQEYTFWRCVKAREPPDPVNPADAVRRWGSLTAAGTVIATQAELAAVDILHGIKTQQKLLEADADRAQLQLMEALGERGDHLVDEAGTLLATWKLDKGRKAYSVAAREPSRRFLLKD